MTLPIYSPNPISINDIQAYFGSPFPNVSLGQFYSGGAYVAAGLTNQFGNFVPSGGTISLRDFYGVVYGQGAAGSLGVYDQTISLPAAAVRLSWAAIGGGGAGGGGKLAGKNRNSSSGGTGSAGTYSEGQVLIPATPSAKTLYMFAGGPGTAGTTSVSQGADIRGRGGDGRTARYTNGPWVQGRGGDGGYSGGVGEAGTGGGGGGSTGLMYAYDAGGYTAFTHICSTPGGAGGGGSGAAFDPGVVINGSWASANYAPGVYTAGLDYAEYYNFNRSSEPGGAWRNSESFWDNLGGENYREVNQAVSFLIPNSRRAGGGGGGSNGAIGGISGVYNGVQYSNGTGGATGFFIINYNLSYNYNAWYDSFSRTPTASPNLYGLGGQGAQIDGYIELATAESGLAGAVAVSWTTTNNWPAIPSLNFGGNYAY